jgi:LysR family hydrogen peroxide-inducible transcriptional activator
MNLTSLTLQQLRYLVAVDRHRNFRDAAAACSVSQPALSMQIKKLEELLGVTVFDRSRQPTMLTEHGASIVAQARRVLEQVDQIGAIVGGGEELSGPYRLGVIPTLVPTLLPLLVPAFARALPRVELEIVETQTEVLLRRLREGTLDGGVAATPLDVPGIHERVVCHEAFFVYLPPDHPLLRQARVRQSDLVDEQVWLLSEGHCFRNQVLHLCSADRHGVVPDAARVRFDGGSFEALVRIVDAGVGLTIVPELLVRALTPAQQGAQVRPFPDPTPVREIGLLHAREQSRKAVTDALFRVLRGAVPPDLVGRRPRRGAIVAPLPKRAARERAGMKRGLDRVRPYRVSSSTSANVVPGPPAKARR